MRNTPCVRSGTVQLFLDASKDKKTFSRESLNLCGYFFLPALIFPWFLCDNHRNS